jgi:hypothetical protein
MTKRRVFLAIGVAKSDHFDYLAAAHNGAHEMYEWATALGYEATLLTDEREPVSVMRLRTVLQGVLESPSGPIERLIIYFAGHGFIREAEEGLWLLSDSYAELRAVAPDVLKRRLYRYDIDQIAIFADACRLLPSNIDMADFTPDGVLPRGPRQPGVEPPIDKFVAAQDGAAAFAIPGNDVSHDRCLFTGVLIQGLWGMRHEAFSKTRAGHVTSQSLGDFLRSEVPVVARRYARTLHPTVSYSFPEGSDIYLGPAPSLLKPTFADWPPPYDVVNLVDSKVEPGPDSFSSRTGRAALGTRLDAILSGSGRESSVGDLHHQLRGCVAEGSEGSGASLANARAANSWSPSGALLTRINGSEMWRIAPESFLNVAESLPTLLELDTGVFACLTLLPGYFAHAVSHTAGIRGLVYRDQMLKPESTFPVIQAIVGLEAGGLRYDDVISIAANLKRGKRIDPMIGVICAYLYDSVGDIDGIRRIAWHYARYRQPIPFDVALLAQVTVQHDNLGLGAFIPAVAARSARSDAEQSNPLTLRATTDILGRVGGMWPWMRQGWSYLDEHTRDGSGLIATGLSELVREVAPARFATLSREGGLRLASLFGLVRTEPPPAEESILQIH